MKSRCMRRFSADMKARIALEAKSTKPSRKIASHYGMHPNQVSTWKLQFIEPPLSRAWVRKFTGTLLRQWIRSCRSGPSLLRKLEGPTASIVGEYGSSLRVHRIRKSRYVLLDTLRFIESVAGFGAKQSGPEAFQAVFQPFF